MCHKSKMKIIDRPFARRNKTQVKPGIIFGRYPYLKHTIVTFSLKNYCWLLVILSWDGCLKVCIAYFKLGWLPKGVYHLYCWLFINVWNFVIYGFLTLPKCITNNAQYVIYILYIILKTDGTL